MTASGGWAYGFDANGNATSKSNAATGEAWTYGYDYRNQLVSAAETKNGTAAGSEAYQYDAFGNRIGLTQTNASGTVVADERFAFDGWDPAKPVAVGTESFDAVADLSASGSVTSRRLFGPGVDMMGARVGSAGDVSWYLTDALGSVRQVTDAAGAVTGSQSWDGFGSKVASSGTGLDRYGWTGREADAFSGLQFNRGRWYDASSGRWTSEDPLGFGGGDTNLYRYAGNGPTNGRDPSGLELVIPNHAADREFWTAAIGADNFDFVDIGTGLRIVLRESARTNAVHERIVNALNAIGITNDSGLSDILINLYDGGIATRFSRLHIVGLDTERGTSRSYVEVMDSRFEVSLTRHLLGLEWDRQLVYQKYHTLSALAGSKAVLALDEMIRDLSTEQTRLRSKIGILDRKGCIAAGALVNERVQLQAVAESMAGTLDLLWEIRRSLMDDSVGGGAKVQRPAGE